jgi:hypothetical protein
VAEENSDDSSLFFVRTLKFVHPQRVGTDQQHFLLDEQSDAIQPRPVGRIDLILGTAIALLVEVEQGVVQAHPNVAGLGVNSKRGQDRQEVGRVLAFVLAIDFATRGAGFGHGVQAGKFKTHAGIPEAIILPD